jgi:hypothetical protein
MIIPRNDRLSVCETDDGSHMTLTGMASSPKRVHMTRLHIAQYWDVFNQ